jgi:hypothetical protein
VDDNYIKEWLWKKWSWLLIMRIAKAYEKRETGSDTNLTDLILTELDYNDRQYGRILYHFLSDRFLQEWIEYIYAEKENIKSECSNAGYCTAKVDVLFELKKKHVMT